MSSFFFFTNAFEWILKMIIPVSSWSALGSDTQLSLTSGIPSLSESSLLSQTLPKVSSSSSAWSGLTTLGQLSHASLKKRSNSWKKIIGIIILQEFQGHLFFWTLLVRWTFPAGVPSKSQKPTILGQGGPSSAQCSNPSWACHSHRLYISYFNLILAKNKKIQLGNKDLVFITVLKWRVVFGAKRMVPTAYPARVWTLGTRWTTLTQKGWVLWFTWDSVCTSFKNTICSDQMK